MRPDSNVNNFFFDSHFKQCEYIYYYVLCHNNCNYIDRTKADKIERQSTQAEVRHYNSTYESFDWHAYICRFTAPPHAITHIYVITHTLRMPLPIFKYYQLQRTNIGFEFSAHTPDGSGPTPLTASTSSTAQYSGSLTAEFTDWMDVR